MKKLLTGMMLITIFSAAVYSQNKESFFKAVPVIDASTPEWARMMYNPNPNIRQVDFEFSKYYDSHPMEKDIHTQNYKFWHRRVMPFMNADGFIKLPDATGEKAFLQKMEKRSQLKSGSAGTWRTIGPFATYKVGDIPDLQISWQANVYCFDQSESRPDILFAGTEAGGLFKSENKGMSWRLISAAIPVTTVNDVKISATNPNLVYFIANNRIYKTTNGGESWNEVFSIGDEGYQLLIHPTNPDIVLCAANNGLYRSTDNGGTWTKLYSGKCWDIKFHPTNPSIVYLAKNNPAQVRCEFFKSTDTGATFSIRENGWYVPQVKASARDIGAKIGVTPAAPDMIYVALIGESRSQTGDNGWIGVYKSTNGGDSWVNPNPPDGGPYSSVHPNLAAFYLDGTGFHQDFYDFALGVSATDPNRVWVGSIVLSQSTNGGASWTRIGSYYAQQDIGNVHPDIQDIHVRGNEIFLATDGGISLSTDEMRSHSSRNYGLTGSDYWGFAQGWNEDVIVGGRYHNGDSGFHEAYGEGNTLALGGGEAPTGYVNPMENRKTYFSDISSALLPLALDEPVVYFQKLGKYPNESYYRSYSSEIEWDPRYAGHLYVGSGGKIWKSTNGGGYFEVLHSFGTGKVLEIEVSRSNPKVIYCVYQSNSSYSDPCSIRKSTDGGITWAGTTAVPTNDRWKMEITLNPENENELWLISLNGYNGKKVYRTLDGGKTWEAMTSTLFNDEQPNDIQFQGGTDGVVYLATSTGAYYFDPSTAQWNEFMNDLPAWTGVMEMKPFYAKSKIRMATNGRSIWETDLVVHSRPVAQPMTQSDTIYNSADTVQFESYSIIHNEGAKWQWAFSPTPRYVSSYTVRNPKVVFGSIGSYDVTLTVTDAENRTSSHTEPGMVTVARTEGPDATAGKALSCVNNGEYAVTEDLKLSTNILTITAWVKPDGIQPEYTGIVMNNKNGTGFNFRSNNNTLGYHWRDANWTWNSRLVVPSGEWSHVALVANATSATLYVNGIPSRHNVTLPVTDITTMDIGSYMGWDSRNFVGMIDEVCIWKRALTQEEIRESAHLTKEKMTDDPDFIGYYQFNEAGGNLFNRVGEGIGSIIGAPVKVNSTAPVGPGSSCRLAVNGAGNYDFTGTGLSMTFPSGGALYPGEMVVTRIQNTPAVMPNTKPNIGCYWVLSGYGSDHFTPLSEMRFTPFTGVSTDTIVAAPDHAKLFIRRIGEITNTWESLCGAASVTAGTDPVFRYTSSCGVGINGCLFMTSDGLSVPLLKGTTSGIDEKKDSGEAFVQVYPNP
ncbi:MAG: hypothetical protein PHY99_02540, partial [Bacteroidales bacterium]|nr:hypothetical protein [Bacteroidales bacterium]